MKYFLHHSGYGGSPKVFDTLKELKEEIRECVNEDEFAYDEISCLDDTYTIIKGEEFQIKTKVGNSSNPDRGKVLKYNGIKKKE